MTISVLINNYNYGRYLARAVASVQAQTRLADEIIVVDDGSTDDSLSIARALASADPRVVVVSKANGGQLSAFHAGLAAASGEIVCFLDADDEYLPGYLQRLEQVYDQKKEIDFVYCVLEFLLADGSTRLSSDATESFDHGISVFRTLVLGDWVGAPTSSLSARRRLLNKVLPCSLEPLWRMRADDVVVIGAAMSLGRKLFLAERHVRYHVHGDNHWFGVKLDRARLLREKLERRALVGHFGRDLILQLEGQADWLRWVLQEFRAIPAPGRKDARIYARVMWRARGRWRWLWALRVHWAWFKHWARSRS